MRWFPRRNHSVGRRAFRPQPLTDAQIRAWRRFVSECNEALAAGLPGIGSSYSQAVEELVRCGENGWVFAPESVGAVQQAIVSALACDPASVATMREAARSSVAHLEPTAIARRMFSLLQQTRLEY